MSDDPPPEDVQAAHAAKKARIKAARDRMMAELHEHHPAYGFDVHKGYSTPDHGAALVEHGPCAQHRFSYVNVRAAMRQTVQMERAAS